MRLMIAALASLMFFFPIFGYTQVRGGSNFAWYNVDVTYSGTVPVSCNREPYGIIANYNKRKVRAEVKAQLASMYLQGQRRLVIPIFYGHGITTGTVVDSTGGHLSATHRANLATFLSDIAAAGFAEVLAKFNPLGSINPIGWTSWSEPLYIENRDFVLDTSLVFHESTLLYRTDLMGEGMPPGQPGTNLPYFPLWSQAVARLWNDYTSTYGRGNTVGYSIAVGFDIEARVRHQSYVYGSNFPYVVSVHLYGDQPGDAYNQFVSLHNYMAAYGVAQGWIVGETFFNDAAIASSIRDAISTTGRTVFYLAQWPLSRHARMTSPDLNCGVHVSEPDVIEFNEYAAEGF